MYQYMMEKNHNLSQTENVDVISQTLKDRVGRLGRDLPWADLDDNMSLDI